MWVRKVRRKSEYGQGRLEHHWAKESPHIGKKLHTRNKKKQRFFITYAYIDGQLNVDGKLDPRATERRGSIGAEMLVPAQ